MHILYLYYIYIILIYIYIIYILYYIYLIGAITRNISCTILQKEILRLCLTSRDYLPILLLRNFCSDYDNSKRMIVNKEYYLLLAAMLLLMIIDEKQNHTAITMTGSIKQSILYEPEQQNFNSANVDDTTKISGYSNQ